MDIWDAYRESMLAGEYFQAHEILEVPWRDNRSRYLQISIWIAAGYVHWKKGQVVGAQRLFRRVLDAPESSTLPIRVAIETWLKALDQNASMIVPTETDLAWLSVWGKSHSNSSYQSS